MASTVTSTTFAPHQSSPLARTTSPFKDPRTPPRTPSQTARIWDEYERRAVEIAKRRETAHAGRSPQTTTSQSSPQRLSSGTVLDIIKSYDPHSSPKVSRPSATVPATAHPHFDFDFQTPTYKKWAADTTQATLAICKTCSRPITSTSGFCEQCKRIIVLPTSTQTGESTPPLSPSCRNFASTDLSKLQRAAAHEPSPPNSSSPKRKSQRPPSAHLNDPPIRLSSLRPPPNQGLNNSPPRARKCSLTDPNEPFIRLQITRKPVPPSTTQPPSPTTPPPTAHSNHTSTTNSHPRTRPSSLANITTPPQYVVYPRHNSATPSELSTLYPYISSTTTTMSPSVHRASYSLQNTTSAWDDSDSEEEEEKAGLVGYWRGRKWRGSRGSLGAHDLGRGRRASDGVEEGRRVAPAKDEIKKKKRGAFVRVISCGCND